MKLDRVQEYVLPAAVTLGGMLLAVVLGYMMGQGRTSYVIGLLAAVSFGAILIALRQYIWLLVPLGWPLASQVPALPVPFAVRDMMIGGAFVGFLMLIALKVVRYKPKYDLLDYLVLAMGVYLVTVFLRNPVGTLATGSARVGGKPYFNTLVAVLGYMILTRGYVRPQFASLPILLMLLSGYIITALNVIADFFPKTVPILANLYAGIEGAAAYNAGQQRVAIDELEASRYGYFVYLGMPTIFALVSFFRPLTLINPLYILRFFFFCIGAFALLLSGFRSAIVVSVVGFVMVGYIRGGIRDLLKIGVIGVFALCVLIAGNGRLFTLPYAAQRALSFLPGKWDSNATADANASNEWRFQMWREYVTTNRYIENRLLGDGFGFSRRDLDMMAMSQPNDAQAQQEIMMIVGNVHSGPLSAIRTVGYVGFALFSLLIVAVARRSWTTIQRASGTPFFPAAIYFGIPAIIMVPQYLLIYGAFDDGLQTTLFSIGMIRLINHSMSRHEVHGEEKSTAPESSFRPMLPMHG